MTESYDDENVDFEKLRFLMEPPFLESIFGIGYALEKSGFKDLGAETKAFHKMLYSFSPVMDAMIFFYKELWQKITSGADPSAIEEAVSICRERRKRFAVFIPAALELKKQLLATGFVESAHIVSEIDEEIINDPGNDPEGFWYVNVLLKKERTDITEDNALGLFSKGLDTDLTYYDPDEGDIATNDPPKWVIAFNVRHETNSGSFGAFQWKIPQQFIDNPMDHKSPLFWFPSASDKTFDN